MKRKAVEKYVDGASRQLDYTIRKWLQQEIENVVTLKSDGIFQNRFERLENQVHSHATGLNMLMGLTPPVSRKIAPKRRGKSDTKTNAPIRKAVNR